MTPRLGLALATMIVWLAISSGAFATSPLRVVGHSPTLPKGKAGTISVVAIGPYNNTLPFVLRNNTGKLLASVKVTATAYVGTKLVATGADQGVDPALLPKGGLAIGYVYFSGAKLPSNTVFHLNATGSAPDEFLSDADVPITTVNYSGGKLVGIGHNGSKKKISGPLSVYATCFDARNKIVAMENGYSDADDVSPGGDAPFTLDFTSFGTSPAPVCPKLLVSITGYTF